VPPCVPYLGISLTDLTFISDANPDYINDKKRVINFSKMKKIAQIIQQIQTFQQTPFCLEPILFIQDFMMKREILTEQEQYTRSLELEEKIPKGQRKAALKSMKKKLKPVQVDFASLNIN